MEILNHPLVKKAAEFAKVKHAHQKRMDGKTPYFAHLEGVATFVAEVYPDAEAVAAGYLHDTIEDTNTDYDKLHSRFGQAVADMVAALTMDNRLPEEKRLAEYRRVLADSSLRTALVKVADILHNLQSLGDAVARAKPDFERKMIEKWNETLRVLWNANNNAMAQGDLGVGFASLYDRARGVLVNRASELGLEV